MGRPHVLHQLAQRERIELLDASDGEPPTSALAHVLVVVAERDPEGLGPGSHLRVRGHEPASPVVTVELDRLRMRVVEAGAEHRESLQVVRDDTVPSLDDTCDRVERGVLGEEFRDDGSIAIIDRRSVACDEVSQFLAVLEPTEPQLDGHLFRSGRRCHRSSLTVMLAEASASSPEHFHPTNNR